MKTKLLSAAVAALVIGAHTPQAGAFTYVLDHKVSVKGGSLVFHINMPGAAPSGIAWNAAFERAAHEWSLVTPVSIHTVRQAANPCSDTQEGIGAVGFGPDLCGLIQRHGFAPTTAAFAMVDMLDRNTSNGGDIVFNSAMMWDVYDGPARGNLTENWRGQPVMESIVDLKRLSAHEIGHILGLGHSQFPMSVVTTSSRQSILSGDLTADDICGVVIGHGRPDMCPLLLTAPVTVSGKDTSAMFVAGASSDRGATFANTFNYWDTLDIMATVVIEDEHVGLPGRLHAIIELSDGTSLFKTSDAYLDWDGSVEALWANSVAPLMAANEIYVLEAFDLNKNYVHNIDVSVSVGYSLASAPDEIYYSGNPLQFRVN